MRLRIVQSEAEAHIIFLHIKTTFLEIEDTFVSLDMKSLFNTSMNVYELSLNPSVALRAITFFRSS